ncbi:hypothetical protein FACS1894110_22890 [Spirochaetia bacterium]|nr:hypothetical protein FACS1894110_22890 [Spirochaetia bacterium]
MVKNFLSLLIVFHFTLLCSHVFAGTIYIPKSDFDFEDINIEIDENLTRAIGKMGYEFVDFSEIDVRTFLIEEGLFDSFVEALGNMNDSPQFIMTETGLSGQTYIISEVYFDDTDIFTCLAVHEFAPVVFDESTLGKTNMFYWVIDNIFVLIVFAMLAAITVLFIKFVFPLLKAGSAANAAESSLEEHASQTKWWKREFNWKREKNGLSIRFANGIFWALILADIIILGSIVYSGITTYTVQKLIPSFSGTREEIEILAADYIAENITYEEGVHGDISMGYIVYLFRIIPIPIPICFPPDSYKVINDKVGDCDEMTFLWMKMLQKSGVFGVEMAISETEQHAWAYDKKTGRYWDVTWYENTNRDTEWLKMDESYYPVEKMLLTL